MSATGDHESMHPIAEQYLTHLTAVGYPKTTTDTYRSALRCACAELPAGLLSLEHELEAWLATRPSPSTRVVYRAALRGFYAWAVRRGLITADPSVGLEPVKRRGGIPRPVPLGQVRDILERASDPARLWFQIALYGGARCIGISRLRREDVDAQWAMLHEKGDKQRLVPTHPELWEAVRHLPPGLLAGGRTAAAVSSAGNRELDRLGYPEVTMHRLRHTAGTLWQEATGDSRVTQQLLGHASLSTVQIYTHVSDDRMRSAVLAMPALSGAPTAADAAPAAPVAEAAELPRPR